MTEVNATTISEEKMKQTVDTLFDALTVQKPMLLSRAGEMIRKGIEDNGVDNPYYRQKLKEFMSDMAVNMMAQMELVGTITQYFIENSIDPTQEDTIEFLDKIRPGYVQLYKDVSSTGLWFGELVGDDPEFSFGLMMMPRPENNLNFLDYNPDADNPLDPYWVGAQG